MERIVLVLIVPDIAVPTSGSVQSFEPHEKIYPLPANRSTSLPSAKKGIKTPLYHINTYSLVAKQWLAYALESRDVISKLLNPAVAHKPTCLSDILLNCRYRQYKGRQATLCNKDKLTPVVAILSRSPSQTTLDPLTPECPSETRTASVPARGSKSRNLRSRHVWPYQSLLPT